MRRFHREMQRRITCMPEASVSVMICVCQWRRRRTDTVRGVQARLRRPFRRLEKEADESSRSSSRRPMPVRVLRFS